MPRSRVLLCVVYGLTAVLALVATWSQNVAYIRPDDGLVGFVLATARFWPDTLTTPAGVSVTVDLGLLFFAAGVWMVVEARRLGIRFVWLYVVLGFLVAISVTFPLFLIARERVLVARGGSTGAVALTRHDRIALGVFGAIASIFSLWTLMR